MMLRGEGRPRRLWLLVLFLVAGMASPALGQVTGAAEPGLLTSALTGAGTESPADADSGVVPAGCSSCGGGGGLLGMPPIDGPGCDSCGGCGANPPCLGQKPCYPCDGDNCFDRFCCCLYQCICCRDPCYEGRWTPLQDSAFFTITARPITQQRLQWNAEPNLIFPDRAEYIWAAPSATASGGPAGRGPTSRPTLVPAYPYSAPSLNYNTMSMYTEVASSAFSFFVEMPYVSYTPSVQDPGLAHQAGFGDIDVGTKTLMYDCELLQLGFMFTTYLPSGNFSKGLGTGHVSLEPTLLLDVKLGPDSYLESQLSEWIPLGGTPGYMGAILHYHASVNKVLWSKVPNVPIIGTAEISGWSFQTGSYTDPYGGYYQTAGGYTYVYLGWGIRMFVCERIDFGVAVNVPVTKAHWADPQILSQFRWRF